MERRLTEEQITKEILDWLESKGWFIISYDFPQSGTGFVLHSCNRKNSSKNKESIIPDIIAIKNEVVVFFENKDRFQLSDFDKISKLKKTFDYRNAISKLLQKYDYINIYYGIGLPSTEKVNAKILNYLQMVDFIVQTNGIETTTTFQRTNIF